MLTNPTNCKQHDAWIVGQKNTFTKVRRHYIGLDQQLSATPYHPLRLTHIYDIHSGPTII